MKRLLVCLFAILLIISDSPVSVYADDPDYDLAFDVVFTAEETIEYRDPETNEVVTDIYSRLPDMIPDDSLRLTFTLKNEHNSSIDWYMKNNSEAFESKSGTTAENAAYDYNLTYGSSTIYSSDVVGGDDMKGIDEATDELSDYFLLDSGFSKGKTGDVVLTLTLDGETQPYNYQDVLGDIMFQFAVEIPPEPTERHEKKVIYIPYTGDTINLTVYIIAEILSLLLLAIVLYAYYRYIKKQKEASR